MARLLILLHLLISITTAISSSDIFINEPIGHKKDNIIHIRFYLHDITTASKSTSVLVAHPSIVSKSFFGNVTVIDTPLTMSPEISSQLVGQAQGMITWADQNTYALFMTMTLAFMEGKYNGSTLVVMGRNQFLTEVREMAVVGGTKFFRFARGYIQVRTYSLDLKTGNNVLEYNCYVLLN